MEREDSQAFSIGEPVIIYYNNVSRSVTELQKKPFFLINSNLKYDGAFLLQVPGTAVILYHILLT